MIIVQSMFVSLSSTNCSGCPREGRLIWRRAFCWCWWWCCKWLLSWGCWVNINHRCILWCPGANEPTTKPASQPASRPDSSQPDRPLLPPPPPFSLFSCVSPSYFFNSDFLISRLFSALIFTSSFFLISCFFTKFRSPPWADSKADAPPRWRRRLPLFQVVVSLMKGDLCCVSQESTRGHRHVFDIPLNFSVLHVYRDDHK